MNRKIKLSMLLILTSMGLYNCATICGGSKYNANILVNGGPHAKILYNGGFVGNGSASIKVNRKDANKMVLVVRQEGCQDQTFRYTSRTFRGWAFVGTVFTFTTSTYIPYGLGIDLLTGALWKPNASEIGVTKHNYKNFQYTLNYTGCESKPGNGEPALNVSVDVLYLKNGSIIRGTLIESDINTQVKIRTKDGSIFVYKIEEVLKVTSE